ncbi:SRPBCC family protein [Winogradskyella bathintestinalis]|uniref:SRPBCC family protein n=1 Tax=Winogradskyella bathintestinalis TaxID=3035208 RepID=A0ABT7ZY56_9FLAO|nr:SRPBCC family protein [Winogradskyella bathintestinalis]MDN3493673.1 SRPBCC family protein [Winogradskyella bathintestinalis]
MRYTTEVLIKEPISVVIKQLSSIDNLKHWQEGLVSTAHISGIPNEIGAKMKFNYSFGKRKMEIIETITKQNFPNELHATYTTKGVRNIQENYFKPTASNYTKWTAVSDFQPTNFVMSLMLFIMPSAFKKQTKTYMTNFKNFVEKGTTIYKP